MREFEHLLVVIVDLDDGDVDHRRLRKWRRGRQAEVPRRHEEDPGLKRSVDPGTGLQSDHHEQREREHRAQQGKAGLPDRGSEDPDRVAQAGCRSAVQQDHGAIAPARKPPAGWQSEPTGRLRGRGQAEVAGGMDWPQLTDAQNARSDRRASHAKLSPMSRAERYLRGFGSATG